MNELEAVSAARVDIDLFVIGAMKAATTGMCDWLNAQPGLALSDPKEPSIFSSLQALEGWLPRLQTLYADAEHGAVRIDGSTDYAKHPAVPGVPARVQAYCPDAKFVYMMRHPVARAISQFSFDWLLGGPNMSFSRALDVNRQLIDNGRYAMQLRQWLVRFPPERFLLVFTESFAERPQTEVERVLDFLGVARDGPVVRPDADRSNETALLVRPSTARRLLRDSRFGQAIRPLLPSTAARVYQARMRKRSTPEVTAEDRRRLEAVFDRDLADLDILLGGIGLSCKTWDHVSRSQTPVLTAL